VSLAAWRAQFLEEPPAPQLVCLVCQHVFEKPEEHDFDLCAYQYRMDLVWRRETGETVYAN
jgi:hypothetical protein